MNKNPKPEEGTTTEAPAAPQPGTILKFRVTKHEAIIGDAHHAKGKLMELPKALADACVAEGLGIVEGVVSA